MRQIPNAYTYSTTRIFQKRDGSRADAYEEEKAFLLPLPPKPFELSKWKIATVATNYHISVYKQNYSVPYEYIKQKVDVRITKSTVEVFYGSNRISFSSEALWAFQSIQHS